MNSGYRYIYRDKDSKSFWFLFEELKANYPYVGHIYSDIILEYYFTRARDSGYLIEDYSCILILDDIPFSAFLGARFSRDGCSKINLFEIPCLAIDSLNISKKQKKQIQIFTQNLLGKSFESFEAKGPDFNNSLPILCEFLLTKDNFKINPVTSKIIDLKVDEKQLKRGIRKSFHSLINWGLNEMKIQVYDHSNIKWEIVDDFRLLHIKEAKKETRSINTWRKQFDAILRGNAFCITAHLRNELVSAAYFIFSDKVCYYGSSASNRDLFEKPLSHAVIWTAILESKKKGAKLFNIGSTYEFKTNALASKKEKNIAYFKEGFGGKLMLNYLVENFK